MRILIAEDEDVFREAMVAALIRLGHEVVAVADGDAAWQLLQSGEPPELVILDWMMPGLDGPVVCRLAREAPALRGLYIIMLTSRAGTANVVDGLRAGANDYITKPFNPLELRVRIHVAARVVQLQVDLASRVAELEAALAEVHQDRGLPQGSRELNDSRV